MVGAVNSNPSDTSLNLALFFVENATKETFVASFLMKGVFSGQFISTPQNKKNEKLIYIYHHPEGCDDKLPKRKIPDEKSNQAQLNLEHLKKLSFPSALTPNNLERQVLG